MSYASKTVMRRLVAIVWLGATTILAGTSDVAAQPIVTSRPPVRWISLGRPGDTTGSDGSGDRIGELGIEPLRLSLLSEYVPRSFREPGCGDGAEQIGHLTGGNASPSQSLLAVNLLTPRSWRTPRLTLFGFSRGGCLLDSAGGGGATLTIPIKRDVFFVVGGGAIYLPNGGPNGSAIGTAKAGASIVFATPSGRSVSIGVSSHRGGPMINVAGVF